MLRLRLPETQGLARTMLMLDPIALGGPRRSVEQACPAHIDRHPYTAQAHTHWRTNEQTCCSLSKEMRDMSGLYVCMLVEPDSP